MGSRRNSANAGTCAITGATRARDIERYFRSIVTDWIVMGLTGRSPGLLVGVDPILFTMSIPSTPAPNTLGLLSSHGVGTSVMKNWLPFVLGPLLAIDRIPGLL